MIQISAVIITYNEEKDIRRCINSLKPIADEIIIVDSFSTDKTKAICLEAGIRFFEHTFEGHIQQKNFALSLASNDYVLSLDADEFLSDQLITSIKAVKSSASHDAYTMNRLTGIAGRWIRSTDWYPDRKLRLWKKSVGKWGGYNPHDKVIVDTSAKVLHLKGNLMHDGYEDYHDLMVKASQYARIFAYAHKNKKSSSVATVLIKTCYTFFRNYILKYGFINGFDGLVISYANACYTFFKYAILRDLNKSTKIKSED